ncbi:hypothetical protein EPUL_002287 [Erysiphe pulchra]|uniref:Reverse transcriptase Ty1/copia-type domain-containing protein n=1 Tax=Erysiphe pulchra TaxID=225359 RepID=A0A2S4PX98_9PEZI|nr:hypothetical protein EPUL_002287 [Erysiphe pulchra]
MVSKTTYSSCIYVPVNDISNQDFQGFILIIFFEKVRLVSTRLSLTILLQAILRSHEYKRDSKIFHSDGSGIFFTSVAAYARKRSAFQVKDLGDMTKFLGIDIQRKPDGIWIHQQDKIQSLCEDMIITHCKGANAPVADDNLIDCDIDTPCLKNEATVYQSAVGTLLHIANMTRPDIQYVHKTLDVITLFHKTNSSASRNVFNILKKASENASVASSGISSSSDSSSFKRRDPFQLEITEELPTRDQLKCILEYVREDPGIESVMINGAKDENDAWKKMIANSDNFRRPLIVDWSRGRATSQTNESEILKMIGL